MSIFTPDIYLKRIYDIDLDMLKKRGIKGLILDIDNTLTEHDSQEIEKEVLAWLDEMKKAGIKLILLSNNNEERVKPFADRIGLQYCCNAIKPKKKDTYRAIAEIGLNKSEVAIVGDQIFTDMLAGTLYGVISILLVPIASENGKFLRFKRILEKPFRKRYKFTKTEILK